MKMSKFKLAFIVLLIATIVWGIAFYITRQEYHRYIEWFSQSEWAEWGLAKPYCGWNGGTYVCITAPFLLLAWIGFIAVAIGKLSERKKPTVNPLEACHRLALKGRAEREQTVKRCVNEKNRAKKDLD